MADIKQAAKWMLEGKSVRRATWPSEELLVYTETSLSQMMMVITKQNRFIDKVPGATPMSLRLESILADDWEIAPQP